jgi:glycine/D-amino acid oxidase-like deaminating enzyme
MGERIVVEPPVIAEVDVLVCGGGPAGIGAAVAAARQGARTMLVEQQGCLGGVATNALIGVWVGSYSRDGAYPVVGGIFTEIVDRLVAEGAAIPASEDAPPRWSLAERQIMAEEADIPAKEMVGGSRHLGYASWHGRAVPFEFEPCKRICEQLALEAGVRLRYFTSAVSPCVEGERIEGLFVHSKNGIELIKADVVVDATGDADVAFRAGCPTVKGRAEDGLMSPATLIFVVEGVDSQAFERYCRQTGDVRFREVIGELKQKGEWPFPFEIIICCEMPRRGRFFINTLRQTGIDGTDADDLTKGMIEGRQQAVELMDILRRVVPGFTDARMTQSAPMLGIRDTRRIAGEYEVTVEDIVQGQRYNDTIALSGAQWDMADPKRPSRQRMEGVAMPLSYVEIPYRSLLPQGIDNLIVAGRCVSSAWDALGPLRIMPACFAMGQAAGIAAAMAAELGITMRNVTVSALREHLVAQGAILTPDSSQ